ncbi:GNAT family N-acetyltransferase [Gordonia sp. MP11Mi]
MLRWEWAREDDPSIGPWRRDQVFADSVDEWMSAPCRTVLVACLGAAPVGMVCLTEHTRLPSPREQAAGVWGYLGHLFVLEDYRRRQVGQRLITEAIAHADRSGHSKVVLSPTRKSVPLYVRCGFVAENNLMTRRKGVGR